MLMDTSTHRGRLASGGTRFIVAMMLVAMTSRFAAQTPADAAAARVKASAGFQAARAELDRAHDQLVAETIALTEIPAPPFKEDARGQAFQKLLAATGLTNVERDAAGNVMG